MRPRPVQRNDHLGLHRLENLMGAKPMTNESDILGRKAARHPTPETVIDLSDVKRNAMKIRRSKA